MIDYRLLLIKYIDMVGQTEGVTFISKNMTAGDGFSQEEADELVKLDGEASAYYEANH